MRSDQVAEDIRPIITGTYGDNGMSRALVVHLAHRLTNFPIDEVEERRGREHMIHMVCWNWFAGGTTAENVAHRIETALGGASGNEDGQ